MTDGDNKQSSYRLHCNALICIFGYRRLRDARLHEFWVGILEYHIGPQEYHGSASSWWEASRGSPSVTEAFDDDDNLDDDDLDDDGWQRRRFVDVEEDSNDDDVHLVL